MKPRKKVAKAKSRKQSPLPELRDPKKKARGRVWRFIILAVVIIAVVGGWYLLKPKNQSVITTQIVQSGTLTQTVEASAVLEAIDKVDLSFDTSGTIDEIYYDVGQTVEAGDLLATLKMDELQADIARAERSVEAAQAQLDLEKAGATAEEVSIALADVAVAESAKAVAEVTLTNARTVGGQTVAKAQVAQQAAADDLENTLEENTQSILSAQDALISEMKSNVTVIRAALSDADEILGVNNSVANDDYESILSHGDPTLLTVARASYRDATESRDASEAAVFALSSGSSADSVESAADLVSAAFADAETVLLQTRQVLDATTIETTGFTSADLSALKAGIDTSRSSLQLEEASFTSARNAWNGAILTASVQENEARNAFAQAQQAYVAAVVSRDADVAKAQADLDLKTSDLQRAQASLSSVKAGPRAVDVAGLIAQVEQANADLAAAKARAQKAEIRAPIAGKVTDVLYDSGEQVVAAQPVMTIQTLQEEFRIVADVAESDIPKIAVGDRATVTFDAFGADVVFNASVVEINPAEKVVDGVTFYESKLYLDQPSEGLKPGMSADVSILAAELPNTIIVPQRAILERDGEKYVRIPSARGYDERIVTTGIRGDDGLVQVLSGLEAGEEVIVSIRE